MIRRPLLRLASRVPRRLYSQSPKTPVIPDPKENKPRAYAPPTPSSPLHWEKKPQIPNTDKPERLSYEAPAEDPALPPPNPRRKKFIPGIAAVGLACWAFFGYQYFMDDTPCEYLSEDKFIPFVITNKLDLDKDHYFLEVTPKFNKWKSDPKQRDQIWDGNRLWSVEVKQPQIMVVRRYTPLPLELYKSEFTDETLVRIQDCENMANNDGKLVFYIKKYDQGEVARWLHRKPVGSVIELRGPYTEFEFPKTLNNNVERPQMQNLPSKVKADPPFPLKPDNLVFYAAGTGIAPALQLLLTKNPYKGFTQVYYSHNTEEEVPIPRVMFFLEKLDRAQFIHLVTSKGYKLQKKHVPSPQKSHYAKYLEQGSTENLVPPEREFKTALEQAEKTSTEKKDPPSQALVCGPDGYIAFVSGSKPFDKEGQGRVGGLLKMKGWDESNVYKM